jgi:SET domain-containing protein
MNLVLRDTPYGKGVFAAAPISKGSVILRFTGPILRYEDTTPETYALQVGPDKYIGASGSLDDYVNHSCDPNAGHVVHGDGTDLIAIRDIAEGEQVTFDYSTTLDEDDFTFACRCGAPNCRGVMRDGKHLPDDVWERYLSLGIIPDYVQRSRARLRGSRG